MNDVKLADFETEVVQASSVVPVLIDFWAPWCGPCKSLGPLLEKLEVEYEGRFKLVKINSDDEQQLAAAFGIRSIPTCILMMNGQPVDGFMGALPLAQLKAFLDKHLPPAEESIDEEDSAEEELDAAPEDRLTTLKTAMDLAPDDDNARFAYLQECLLAGQLPLAQAAFAPAAPKQSVVRRFESVALLLNAIKSGAAPAQSTSLKAQFDAKIAANKRDFEARYDYACTLLSLQQYTAAMDELMEILMRDKSWQEGRARKLYVAILDLLDRPKPKVAEGQIPPEDPLIASYRRRLSSVVLS